MRLLGSNLRSLTCGLVERVQQRAGAASGVQLERSSLLERRLVGDGCCEVSGFSWLAFAL